MTAGLAGVQALVGRLEEVLELAGMRMSLAACGVTEESLPELAREAAEQWTAGFNPREASAKDFEELYRAAFDGRAVRTA